MKRVIGVVAAVVVALGIAGVVWLQGSSASGQQPKAATTNVSGVTNVTSNVKVPIATKSYSITVGGVKRGYEVIAPVKGLPKTAPIIFMLSGIGPSTISGKTAVTGEIARDDLVPYAVSDQAELVYPEPLYGSWNAIGCCGEAAAKNVNDLAFLEALVPKVDPGHVRHVYLVGYSNGARMAYRVVCEDPGLFGEYAMVKGEPMPGCGIRKPTTILEIASVNDPEVPYKPGDHGSVESLPMTTLVSQLHQAETCPANSTVSRTGELTLTTWPGCAGGARLGFGVWSGGVHSFPRPPGSVPAASQVIWAFFTQTPIAPLPR
jgi:polyhydroxybutyrate depolymerase